MTPAQALGFQGTTSRLVSLNGMRREAEYYFVAICFPAFLFGLIVLYLYFKDRNKRR